MAGPAPRDNYNPTQSVEPTTNAPNDYLNVRATPQDFGSQVGEATQGLGKTIGNVGTEASNAGVAYQGMLNEHAATVAENTLAVQGGDIYEKYKNLQGLDAANSKDKAVQDYLGLNQKIRDSLGNPAAQRAYDQMATRRISFVIQDMNGYAGLQTQKAFKDGNTASQSLAIDSASKFATASNDRQFGTLSTGPVIFTTNTDFTAPGWGKYQTLPVSTDKTTGRLQFDTGTDQGKVAQADYDNTLNIQLGKAWSNRIISLAIDPNHGNYKTAVQTLLANKDKIPAATFNELSGKLDAPYHSEITRQASQDALADLHSQYLNQTPGLSFPTNLGNVKQADGSFANPSTPVDGAILAANNLRSTQYQGLTLAQIGAKWEGTTPENVNNWVHNVSTASGITPDTIPNLNDPGTLQKLLKGMSVAEKSTKDRALFSDQAISQGVSASLSGKKATLSQGGTPVPNSHSNLVDFVGLHESDAIQSVRQKLADQGFDITVQDEGARRVQSDIAEQRAYQQSESRAMRNSFISMVTDEKHPITSENMLEYNPDPKVKQDWINYQALDPWGAGAIKARINQQARGLSKAYGTDFYSHYADVLDGKVKPDDLQSYFGGDNAPISASGTSILDKAYQGMQTPQGQAFAHAEKQFLDSVEGQVTGSKVFPGINPAILKNAFDKQLMELIPQIEAKRADLTSQGKNPTDMFDSNNKQDYVGKNVRPVDLDKAIKAMVTSSMSGQPFTAPPQSGISTPASIPSTSSSAPETYKTIDDVGKAWNSGKFGTGPEAEKKAYKIIQDQFGGFAPGVPKPQ